MQVLDPRLSGSIDYLVTYSYAAAEGEANRLVLADTPGGDLVFRVSGARIDVGASGCAPLAAGEVSCPRPPRHGGAPASYAHRVSTGDLGDSLAGAVVADMGKADDRAEVIGPAVVDGGEENDVITGGATGATFSGGAGNDRLTSAAGDDKLLGGPGNDSLGADAGNDRLEGGAGRDVLRGEGGNDHVAGGPGRDLLTDGPGLDRMSAGAGNDELRPDGNPRGLQSVGCGSGRDVVAHPDRFVLLARDCEVVTSIDNDQDAAYPRLRGRTLIFTLGCDAVECGASTAASLVLRRAARPPRTGHVIARRRYRVRGRRLRTSVAVRLAAGALWGARSRGGLQVAVHANAGPLPHNAAFSLVADEARHVAGDAGGGDSSGGLASAVPSTLSGGPIGRYRSSEDNSPSHPVKG